ncbi:unnamed protein product, partial [Rotaria sp. Silwood2]
MVEKNDFKNHISIILGGPEWLIEIKNPTIKAVSTLQELLINIFDNNMSYHLFIPSQYLTKLIENHVHNLVQVDSIHSYYNSAIDYQSHTKFYE